MTQLASQLQGGTGKSVTVAGIDCGTNSIRLKISRVDANGYEDIVPRVLRVVRLGQDVDKTHRFADEALKRCLLYTSPSPRDRQKSRMPSSA